MTCLTVARVTGMSASGANSARQRYRDTVFDSVAPEPGHHQPPTRTADAVLIGVLAAVISGAAAGRPSLWFDEAATIAAAANRSLPELWRMLGHIDAVHGMYYLFMHGWFAAFPATEFWSRLPSALAVGVGAAGVVVLTELFCTRLVAVCSGMLFAVLPRITWAGIEARPYAFSAMTAAWLTVLCVVAVRRDTLRAWLRYGLLAVVSTLISAFSVLVVVSHAVVILVLGNRRSTALHWVATAGPALMAMTPFLFFSQTQIGQVNWISPLGWRTATELVEQQYFDKSVPFALLSGLVIVAAVGARRAGLRPPPAGGATQLSVICAAWILIPTIITLAYSAVVRPVYYPRYLIGTAPAMAVVLGICVATITTRPWGVVTLMVFFSVATAPNYLVTQRDRHAKEGWDYSQVADVVKAYALPGDCLVVDNTTGWRPGPIRALLAARPDAFDSLADPGRGPRGPKIGQLWDGHLAVWAVTDRLDQCPTIWTLTNHDPTLPAHQAGDDLLQGPVFARTPAGQVLRRLGFRTVERWQFTFTQVIRSAH
ncbi:MAG TPA: glycosyltransferase family 39 protein [Mycobacterium sp.]